jgi:hypothetical protein
MTKQINEGKFEQVRALLTNTMCEYIDCFIDTKVNRAYYEPTILLDNIVIPLCENNRVKAIQTLRTAVQDMQKSLTVTIAKNDDLRNAFVRAVTIVNEHGAIPMRAVIGEYNATVYFASKHFGLKDAKDLIDLIDDMLREGDIYLQAYMVNGKEQ